MRCLLHSRPCIWIRARASRLSALDELEYLVTFHRSISQAMARTMLDLPEGVFISMVNFTLACRQLPGVFTALRTAPVHLHFFPDQLLVKAKEEVSKSKDRCFSGQSQPSQKSPIVGGLASAGEQKCSRTGSNSKITGVLQQAIFGTQTQQPVETYLGPEYLEHLPKHIYIPPYLSPAYTDLGNSLSRARLAGKQGEISTGSKIGFQLCRLPV